MVRPSIALALLLLAGSASAQFAGSRGGVVQGSADVGRADPEGEVVSQYIAVEGKVEVRVEPTEVRMVLALTSEGDSAAACRRDDEAQQTALRTKLDELGIGGDAVYVDFISLLPVYDWKLEQQEGRKVAVERRVGYRLQSNVHVRLASDQRSRTALTAVFELGIADVIAFDYWNGELDAVKVRAQERALAEAKRKAGLLLSVFEEKPRPVNVHEATFVEMPSAMYRSFESAYAAPYQASFRDDTPRIAAFRPKNTYYHGFDRRVDVGDPALPMRPRISVVARVVLYFASPAASGPEPTGRPR